MTKIILIILIILFASGCGSQKHPISGKCMDELHDEFTEWRIEINHENARRQNSRPHRVRTQRLPKFEEWHKYRYEVTVEEWNEIKAIRQGWIRVPRDYPLPRFILPIHHERDRKKPD